MHQHIKRIARFLLVAVAMSARAAETSAAYEVGDADRAFLSAVVAALDNKDARWIASHAMLPMTVNTSRGRKLVQNEDELADAVAPLLTNEYSSAIKSAAQQPLFRNWQGVMVGDGLLWFEEFRNDAGKAHFAILALGGFARQPTDQRGAEAEPVAPAFKVHGRLSVYNGNPDCRIWIAGTKRILGIAQSGPPEVSFMPGRLSEMLTTNNLIFADFTVVPLTKDEPGVMRMVRVAAAENVVITDSHRKFLRRVPGRIEE